MAGEAAQAEDNGKHVNYMLDTCSSRHMQTFIVCRRAFSISKC